LLDPFGFGVTGYDKHKADFQPLPSDLHGLRVAVTGANSGLGFATASKLANLGAKVYILCRDQGRGEAARDKMGGDVTLLRVDMADYRSIMELQMPEVDVLIHNAGAMFDKRSQAEGWPNGPIDATFALHVAGPYLLSQRVKTKETIWVSSGGMYSQKLNVASLLSPPEPFDGMVAYA